MSEIQCTELSHLMGNQRTNLTTSSVSNIKSTTKKKKKLQENIRLFNSTVIGSDLSL